MHNAGLNLPKIIKRLRFFRPAQSEQMTADRVQEVQILSTLATSDSYEVLTTAHSKKQNITLNGNNFKELKPEQTVHSIKVHMDLNSMI